MSSFDRLIAQIDDFIRKFYKNQLVKGTLLFTGVLLVSFLLVVVLEYLGRFNTVLRAGLFFGFIAVNGYIIARYVVNPIFKLRSFGNRINRYQASAIIGKFFPTISDRLLNTLQLQDRLNENSADLELLQASVMQRSDSMRSIPFADAIDLTENRRYLVWVGPLVLSVAFLFWLAPGVIQQGTERVVNFSKDFPIEAPFEFVLENKCAEVLEGENLPIKLKLVGEELPTVVYINSRQGKFLLKQTSRNTFEGNLNQLRQSTDFFFTSGDFRSETFNVNVIGKASIGKFDAFVDYPEYLGLKDEVVRNATDLVVPEGTVVSWSLAIKNSRQSKIKLENKVYSFKTDGYTFKHRFLRDDSGWITIKNRFNGLVDTTHFSVQVVPDEFPTIDVEEVKDSLSDGIRFFSGQISDDHGLTNLKFHYTITRISGEKISKKMSVTPVRGLEMPFDFAVDFRREDVQLEDRIDYYFSISDNDLVNGGKTTRSRSFVYRLPTLEELTEKRAEDQANTNESLKDLIDKADKFKKDLDNLRKETNNNSRSDWEKENQVNQLQEEHSTILEDLQRMKEKMDNSIKEKDQLSEMDKELLDQQELINDLLEELMDDELRELLEKLEELLKEQNKDQLEENFEQLEMSSEEMKKQLDRSLEMLKKLQVDERIDDVEKKLKELSDQQEELAKELKDSKQVTEEQLKEQEEIDKAFQEIKEDLKDLDSLNKELERPMDLGNPERDAENVQESLNDAKEQLDKNKQEKGSQSQQQASDQMQEMAEQLDQMQQQANQQQQEEDISMLRAILESLVSLSFDQEATMKNMSRISDSDPAYIKNGRRQRRIIDDTKIVSDSLYALATRQPKIARFIDEELNQIHVNHELSLENIDERKRQELQVHQQFAMTSYNNLALMLNESLQDMQKQLQQSKPGGGSCNKPGGKGVPKPGEGMSPGNMKQMLQKQLEQMQKGQGDKPGEGEKPGQGQNPGQGAGQGMGLGNEGLAKMAAEQSAIRRRLEEMRKELNKDGSGNGNKLNPLLKELEEQQNDLINKRLNENTIKRQKDILTRLLDSEKAMMERGFDEKRESKEGKNESLGNQIRFEEYNKEKLKQLELLRSVDPTYKKYYKDRANEYFNRIL